MKVKKFLISNYFDIEFVAVSRYVLALAILFFIFGLFCLAKTEGKSNFYIIMIVITSLTEILAITNCALRRKITKER